MPVAKPKLIRRITEVFIETPEDLDELDDDESDDDEDSDTDEESDKPAAQRRKR